MLFVSGANNEKSVTFLLDLVLAYPWRVGGAWKPMPGLVVMEMVDLVSDCSVSSLWFLCLACGPSYTSFSYSYSLLLLPCLSSG